MLHLPDRPQDQLWRGRRGRNDFSIFFPSAELRWFPRHAAKVLMHLLDLLRQSTERP
jgi:trans-aconitate methyltransferase